VKVGLVVPGFSAHERDWCIPALLDYVRVLAQQAEVHVFALRWPERSACYDVYGARVRALGGARRLGPRVVGLWARAVSAIAAEHKRGVFDVLHAFWVDEPGWVAAWAGHRLGVPVVLSLAGGELMRLPDIGYGLQLLPGRRIFLQWANRQASAVTAGSRYLCDLARHGGLAPGVRWAPLGVDTNRFAPSTSAAAEAAASAATIVSVGSLVPVKDHALLLRVIRRLAGQVPGLQLLIAGEGPLAAGLASEADGLPVRFLGAVDHGALPALYAQAALLVQTSRHEAQGLAVLEAAACGVAPVGTPVGVLPEVGRTAETEAGLAQALVELLRDDRCRQALAGSAHARVLEDFELQACVDRFGAIYAEVCR
jgi:glycosyltransferase involved in cell wall biosynthesis